MTCMEDYFSIDPHIFGSQNANTTVKRKITTPSQMAVLEQAFAQSANPSLEARQGIAARAAMTPRNVQVWFSNRRSRLARQNRWFSPDRPSTNPPSPTEISMPPFQRSLSGSYESSTEACYASLARSLATAAAYANPADSQPAWPESKSPQSCSSAAARGIPMRGHNPFFPSAAPSPGSRSAADDSFSMYRSNSVMSDATVQTTYTQTPLTSSEPPNPFEFEKHLSPSAEQDYPFDPSMYPEFREACGLPPIPAGANSANGLVRKSIPSPSVTAPGSPSAQPQSPPVPDDKARAAGPPQSKPSRPLLPRRNTLANLPRRPSESSSSGETQSPASLLASKRRPKLSPLSVGMTRSQSSMGESCLSNPFSAGPTKSPNKSTFRTQPYARSPVTPLKRTTSNFESSSESFVPQSSRGVPSPPNSQDNNARKIIPNPSDHVPLSPVSPFTNTNLEKPKSIDISKAMRYAPAHLSTEQHANPSSHSKLPLTPLAMEFAQTNLASPNPQPSQQPTDGFPFDLGPADPWTKDLDSLVSFDGLVDESQVDRFVNGTDEFDWSVFDNLAN